MPRPTSYPQSTVQMLGTILANFGSFLDGEDSYMPSYARLVQLKPTGSVERPYLSDKDGEPATEKVFTKPGDVKQIEDLLISLYEKTLMKLGTTDAKKEPFTHAMLSVCSGTLLDCLNGSDLTFMDAVNPFYHMRSGRMPDFVNPSRFSLHPPVTDPDQLIEELKEPGRELSGYAEANILMRRFPFTSMLEKLTENSSLFEEALQSSGKKNLKEQETLRQTLLDGCLSIRSDAEKLVAMSEEDLAAFSKIFNPNGRESAVKLNWLGDRGIKNTLLAPLGDIQMALENHVPFSHLDVMVQAIRFSRTLENGFKDPDMDEIEGIDGLKEEHRKFKALVTKDFSSFSPEEAAAHMNLIGVSARSLINKLQEVESVIPPETTLTDVQISELPKQEQDAIVRNRKQHLVLHHHSISTSAGLSGSYIDAKLNGNVSLEVMGAAPPADRIQENNIIRPQENIINQQQDNVIIQPQDNVINRPQADANDQQQDNVINRPQDNAGDRLLKPEPLPDPLPDHIDQRVALHYMSVVQAYGALIGGTDPLMADALTLASLSNDGSRRLEDLYDDPDDHKEATFTSAEKITQVAAVFSSTYKKAFDELEKTDKAADPYKHALLSSFCSELLLPVKSGDLSILEKINPFYTMRSGRIPDLLNPSSFTGNPPVLDPDQLFEELKDPDRELSGFEEANVLMKRFPFASLIQSLTDNTLLMDQALHDSDRMGPDEQEKLRKKLLNGCNSIREDTLKIVNMSDEEAPVFCKLLAPGSREGGFAMNWKGDRGLKATVLEPLQLVQTALENHVPFSHLDVMINIMAFSRDLEEKLKLPGIADAEGIDALKAEHEKFKELINKDFSTLLPGDAAAHMNKIGDASDSLVRAIRTVKDRLPQEAEALHRALDIRNVSRTGELSTGYLNSRLKGNVRLDVPVDDDLVMGDFEMPDMGPQPDVAPAAKPASAEAEAEAEVDVPFLDAKDALRVTVDTHMNDGQPYRTTLSTMTYYLSMLTTTEDQQANREFFGAGHTARALELMGNFEVEKWLPWAYNELRARTVFGGKKAEDVKAFFTSAHEETRRAFMDCDREKTPFAYAMRSYAEFFTGTAAAGLPFETEDAFNPFYTGLSSRMPNFIKEKDFSNGAPVTDPHQLIEQLRDPNREVSCQAELELLAKQYPLADMMCDLADNMKRFQKFRIAGQGMLEVEKDALRRDMLECCGRIRENANKLLALSPEDQAVLSKMFPKANRRQALLMDQMGARGLEAGVLRPMARVEKILRNGVDPDRVTAYLAAYQVLDLLKYDQKKNPVMDYFRDRGAAVNTKAAQLTALLDTDLTGKSPEERRQHYEAASAGMTELYQLGKRYAALLPDLPADHPDYGWSGSLKSHLGQHWAVRPRYIVHAFKNGDVYQIGQLPPDIPENAQPEAAPVQQEEPMQARIDRMAEQAEILSNLYLHLHNEGHSYGGDSGEYKHFRDAVKAVHRLWNPAENRALDLSTPEGREQAQALFNRAKDTALAYYQKHEGRDIKSTYGNVRRNAALTAIDTLAPETAKAYIADYAGAGMKMVRDGKIVREPIRIDDLIRKEKAYSTLRFGNKDSGAYNNEADKIRKRIQNKENDEADNQLRKPQKVTKEEAVNRYLGRRNRH